MIGTIFAILTISIFVCTYIIIKLLNVINRYKREVNKLRGENKDMWSYIHDLYIKRLNKADIEDGM